MMEHAQSDERPRSEFLCQGCGRPLDIELRSSMCFAEAQVNCADCERDYQEGRGKWADRPSGAKGLRFHPTGEG